MAAHHIGKQTNHQRDGLGEDAENFNHRHQRQFQSHGHVGPENFFPVFFVAGEVGHQECGYGKHHGHCQIAGKIGATGKYHNQAQQVHREDEEEASEQIGAVFRRLFAHNGANRVVVHKFHNHFQSGGEFARRFHLVLFIPISDAHHHQHHQDGGNEDAGSIFGDREIKWPIFLSIGISAHHFTFMVAALCDIKAIVGGAMRHIA